MPRRPCRRSATPDSAGGPIYWDASAVLSVLVADVHSTKASAAARSSGVHLLSTLASAEAFAIVARLEREGSLRTVLANDARDLIVNGPWRRLALQPDWKSIQSLSPRWPLRGANLWHLALADTLRRDLPELKVISFDARLSVASQGIGLQVIS